MSRTATETTMAGPIRKGIRYAIRRYSRETRAISAVEFALLTPLMLTLLLGGTELTEAITIKRKTILATRTIGDLVSQSTSISNTDMTAIFNAAQSVLSPFSSTNLKIKVSSVGIDNNGNAKIIWSDAAGGATPNTVGSSVTLPAGKDVNGNDAPSLGLKNASIIWAEGEYDYTPLFGYIFTQVIFPDGVVPLKDHVYLRPRLNNYVCRNTGSQNYCS
jgi:Flp pilus assembly protein TadG